MIIIWRGVGGLVLLIAIGGCLFVNIITSAVFHHDNYFQAFLWPKIVALWLIAVICWFVGKYFNGKPGRIVIDKATGQEVCEKPNHHLMFVKMEYWGPIFLVISLVVLVVGIFGG